MNTAKINEAIALRIGYKPIPEDQQGAWCQGYMTKPGAASWGDIAKVPEFFTSLDAMQIAEGFVKVCDCWNVYCSELIRTAEDWNGMDEEEQWQSAVGAWPSRRALAFCRVMGIELPVDGKEEA